MGQRWRHRNGGGTVDRKGFKAGGMEKVVRGDGCMENEDWKIKNTTKQKQVKNKVKITGVENPHSRSSGCSLAEKGFIFQECSRGTTQSFSLCVSVSAYFTEMSVLYMCDLWWKWARPMLDVFRNRLHCFVLCVRLFCNAICTFDMWYSCSKNIQNTNTIF